MSYFVRIHGQEDKLFESSEEARAYAKEYALKSKNERKDYNSGQAYWGSVGGHPMDDHFYRWDSYFKDAVEFCCND